MKHESAAGERLQKVLARAGIASRRAAEALIVAGRVRVNGRVVSELGVRVDRRAKVEVDGRRVVAEQLVYLVLHKPRGVVCTLKDPEGRPTIAEYLKDVGARVVPVGRLDFHTSGALLCTNDGEFASRLAHPRYHAQKEYVAKVRGVLDESSVTRFAERIEIDGKVTRPAHVRFLRVEGDKTWIEVKLEEGRNRQVRRLGEHAGFPVLRLVRTAHAGITTEDLRPGEWRYLDADELSVLQTQYGVPRRVRPAPPPPERSAGRSTPKPVRTRGRPKPVAQRREPARVQTGRPQRDERLPRDDRRQSAGWPQRDERPQRAGRAQRDERPQRTGRAQRDERPQRTGRAQRDERPQRTGRAQRDERPQRAGWSQRDERPQRAEPSASARGARAFARRRGT